MLQGQRPLGLVFLFFFTKSAVALCLQVENSSFLELRVAFSGLKIISNFSLMHKSHLPDTAENGAALPTISRSTRQSLFSSFSFHMYVDSVVAFLSEVLLKSDLCFWNLVFNSPAVSPT